MEEDISKIVSAIGSFILTCILFACPIATALLIQANRFGFFGLISGIISLLEFFVVVGTIYLYSRGGEV